MNWTELLRAEIASTFNSAEKLMGMVDEDKLDWKPGSGENWMTTGQLLRHMTEACGFCFNGFVTGNWMPPEDLVCDEGEMLPPAEKLPAVKSVAEARERLAADKEVALRLVEEQGEEALGTRKVAAPWNPEERILGHQLLGMVAHLETHKNQLYYYLKLQGKPVNTFHMYGMA